jgi:hypothetical protein
LAVDGSGRVVPSDTIFQYPLNLSTEPNPIIEVFGNFNRLRIGCHDGKLVPAVTVEA